MIPLFEKAHQLALTEMEKEILEYFEKNMPRSVRLSLNEVSGELYTSNATIVRFCQKLGLKGYNEFKYQVRSEWERLHYPVESAGNLISRSVARFRDNIDAIDMAKVQQIADLLTGDQPVYIYGSNLSSLAAKYLQVILTTLDYPSILIDWEKLLIGLSHGISSNSVLFVISAHGDAAQYLSIFKKVREQNATVILLTCEENSPLMEYSSICICTNDENEEYHHVDINTRVGIFTVIQLLIELVAQKTSSNHLLSQKENTV